MPANTSISLVNNDFDSHKASLIAYLSSQDKFKSYDFTGASLNVLLDILSHNTFQNTFFLNMAISEAFLDSAQLKNSVLSHAKELNYTPRSSRSAKARVKVNFRATGESQPYIIQKGESFSTMVKNKSYIFSIPESIIVSSINNDFEFETDIYEGFYLKDSFIYLNTSDIQRFRLTNTNVDTESITVVVYEDNSIFGKVFKQTNTLLDLNEFSDVYFLQATENGYYEILFGDGILGAKPKVYSTIVVDYRLSNADGSNGARNFVINFDPTGVSGELESSPIVTLINPATNGAPEEDINSVKFYAPRHFQVQDRAIVPSDYELLLKQEYPEINAISAFGGEELIPPTYGKIYISVDISNVTGFPDSKKKEYYNFIKRKCSSSITPVFLTPEYTYLSVQSFVRYNINLSTNSSERIRTLVTNTITEYNKEHLNDFNTILRFSKFGTAIDDTDISIISNNTSLKIYKKIQPKLNEKQNISINFGIPLSNELADLSPKHLKTEIRTVSSTYFTYSGETCTLEDDGLGNIRVMKVDGAYLNKISDIGKIDYNTGTISLNNFNINAYQGNYLKLYVVPADSDIAVAKNNIFTLEPDEIMIEVMAVRE